MTKKDGLIEDIRASLDFGSINKKDTNQIENKHNERILSLYLSKKNILRFQQAVILLFTQLPDEPAWTRARFLHITLHYMKKDYEKKYGTLEPPTEADIKLYTKQGIKHWITPNIWGEEIEKDLKEPKKMFGTTIRDDDRETLFLLLHNLYIKEIYPKYQPNRFVRFSTSVFMYELLDFFEKNYKRFKSVE